MKLVGNSSIVSAIECISEAMTLADRNGLARDDLLTFFGYMFPGAAFAAASGCFDVGFEHWLSTGGIC